MKAQGLAINVVILAVMALSVLMFMTTFMSGGFRGTTDKVTSFSRESVNAESAGRSVKCNTECTMWISKRCTGAPPEGLTSSCKKANGDDCKLTGPENSADHCKKICGCP